MPRTAQEDQHTAYHEAGHAVAHHFFQQRIELVTIVPDEATGSAGRTGLEEDAPSDLTPDRWKAPAPTSMDFADAAAVLRSAGTTRTCNAAHLENLSEMLVDLAAKARLEEDLLVTFAGEAATYILTGENDPTGAGRHPDGYCGDARIVWDRVTYLFDCGADAEALNNKEAAAYWEWMWWRAVNLLRLRGIWERVEAVASALVERRTLTGEEVDAIIKRTAQANVGPLATIEMRHGSP